MPERSGALVIVPAIAVGGAIGSLVRAWADALIPRDGVGAWPWSTLLVNVVGAFALGVVLVLLASRADADSLRGRVARPFLVTGVLGGLTTFSAYSEEVRDLLASGHVTVAATYAVGSVLAGVAAVAAGRALAHRRGGVAPHLAPEEVDEA